MKFITYLFYRYYKSGRNADRDPYFRSLCSFTVLIWLQGLMIASLFGRQDLMFPRLGQSGFLAWLSPLIVFLPVYLLLNKLVPKDELIRASEKYDYDWDRVFKASVWLVVYIIALFISIVLVIYFKQNRA